MPIIRQPGAQTGAPAQQSFVERIRAGRVVPVISGEGLAGLVFGDYAGLVRGYAKSVGYPLADHDNLTKVAKYHQLRDGLSDWALKSDFLNWYKNHVFFTAQAAGADADLLAEAESEVDRLSLSDFATRLGYPHLDAGPADPLLVLASLPARTFVTTCPATFLEAALRRAGKSPRTEVCRWRKELDGIDSAIDAAYRPSAREPLVYHLHGLDTYPDSLVLTEDDHLEFLVNVCQGQGNHAVDRVHGLVRTAFIEDLILLGFSLSDWSFRSLYMGLIKAAARTEDRGICALQLTPDEHERQFLEDYARREAHFDVFWGEVGEYAALLQQGMAQ
jgi:hypothetical protein